MRLSLFWKIISPVLLANTALAGVRVTGTVLEKGTTRPLANVNIYVLPEALKTTTNTDGEFVFAELPAGEREWIITVTGYKRFKQKFTYNIDTDEVKIYIERKSYAEFETTVVGKVEKRDPAKRTLRQEEFLKVPGAGGDPIRAVENLPGVGQSFDANVAIQGSPPEDTKYLIEGHEIPFIFHFLGLNTVAVPETIKSVDFLSAGYGSEFGRASSGVINLNLRQPRTDRIHGMAFVDFTAAGGFIEGKTASNENRSFFFGGRYSYLGQVVKLAADFAKDASDNGRPPAFDTAPTYFDVNFSYHDKLSDKLKFTFITLASRDKVVSTREDAKNTIFSGTIFGKFEFFRLIPKINYQLAPDTTVTASLAAGADWQRFRPGRQKLNLTNQHYGWRSEYRQKISDRYILAAGTDFVYERFNNEIRASAAFFDEDDLRTPLSATKLLITNDKGDDIRQGYYLSNKIEVLKDKLTLTPNLRYDYFGLHRRGYLQPRGGIIYKLSNDANLYLNAGLYYQPETSVSLGAGTGNPELKPTHSIHYALKYERDFRQGSYDGFVLASGIFYKDLRDLKVSSSNQIDTDAGFVPERFSNAGEGSVRGAELMLKYKQSKAHLNIGYTYTRSRRNDPKGKEYPSQQDQTHNLNVSGAYRWGNYSLASRFRYVTGIPYTPIKGGVYFENADTYIQIAGDKLSERIKDFWQLDVRVDRQWIYNTWILSLYIDIQNVTLRDNQIGTTYNFDYSQREPTTWLPILPTFGIKGEF